MIVADANLIAALCFNSVRTQQAQRIRKLDNDWIVPPLFRSEMLSVLGQYLRQGSIDRDQAIRAFRRAHSIVTVVEDDAHATDVLKLLANSRCSSYDLEYVAVAQRYGIPLVTADAEVIAAFPGTAWSFDQFEQNH